MPRYAKNEPAGFSNTIERIAIVGAGGTVGVAITAALLATGKHIVTAISREGSRNELPPGVQTARVDYEDESSIVAALKGQQFLIITMSPTAPQDTTIKLIRAAAKAGLPYVLPNAFAGDIDNVKLGEDTLLGPSAEASRDEVERLGMHWIAVCCNFWYDYSLAGGENRFGFDFNKRTLTFYDDGTAKISTSTLAQVGRAVARVASFKEFPQDGDDHEPTFSDFLNKGLYIKSFVVSQRDMFESVKRVTDTTDNDWTVTHESSHKRYQDGLAQVKSGNMVGFSKLLYARTFYPNESSDLSPLAQNVSLGLPEESLDDATRKAVRMVAALEKRPERMAS